MSYIATAFARDATGWVGDELVLDDVEDLDGMVELVRDTVGDDADVVLLALEEDDEWVGVLRLDADDEPRVFVSDARVLETSDLAAVLGEAAVDREPVDESEEPDDGGTDPDDDDQGASIDGEPVGDASLLSDLGTTAARLLALCAAESVLPGDVIAEVCEAAGCLDVLERLRGQ
ncbi:MAG TPA: tRNA adenosine deaminase-associated protein [Mycobacteriales bacterium]|nr:tRNA adenosine deaminase-associated protein [Mycobacteriales bacterium]